MSNLPQRVLILCTVEAGLDTLSELVRLDFLPHAIVGLHPDKVNPEKVSGYLDVAPAAKSLGINFVYVNSYSLTDNLDKDNIEKLNPDLILVLGWQRLVPEWLIKLPQFGVLGGHGSPDGINGGRGRSPQNWAIMLGCQKFDLSLFRITSGVDEGPVLETRSFYYTAQDDIRVSYYRASLLMAEMINEVLIDPTKLSGGDYQEVQGFYYPQRKPEDGWVDWTLCTLQIEAHCRALTKPYPGLITSNNNTVINIWKCQHFDDRIESTVGVIGACFETGEFLVNCKNGRLLVREWSSDNKLWRPRASLNLDGKKWQVQLQTVIDRHNKKYPEYPLSPRILRNS